MAEVVPSISNLSTRDWLLGLKAFSNIHYNTNTNNNPNNNNALIDDIVVINSDDGGGGGFFAGEFIPPPPRPLFLEESAAPDGLTTCDLCSWAYMGDNPYTIDTNHQEGPGELGWVITLVIVSLISAIVGAIIMIVALHCRRLKHANSNGDSQLQLPRLSSRRSPVSTTTTSKITPINTISQNTPLTNYPPVVPPPPVPPLLAPAPVHLHPHIHLSPHHHHLHHNHHQHQHDHSQNGNNNNGGVWSWLSRRSRPSTPSQLNHPPSLGATENHYTHMEDGGYDAGSGSGGGANNSNSSNNNIQHSGGNGEGLYAELDTVDDRLIMDNVGVGGVIDSGSGGDLGVVLGSESARQRRRRLSPAYQNSAYEDAPASSAPSSAYYSDLSVSGGGGGGERAYEVVGVVPPSPSQVTSSVVSSQVAVPQSAQMGWGGESLELRCTTTNSTSGVNNNTNNNSGNNMRLAAISETVVTTVPSDYV